MLFPQIYWSRRRRWCTSDGAKMPYINTGYTHTRVVCPLLSYCEDGRKKKRNRSKTTSSVFRSFFFSFVIGATQLHHKSPDSRGWQHHGGSVEKLSKQPDRTKLHDKQRCHVEFLPRSENAQRWRTSEQTAAYQCAVTHGPPQSLAAVLFARREATLTTRIIFTFHICKEKTEFHLLIQVWNNNLGKLEMWFFFFF